MILGFCGFGAMHLSSSVSHVYAMWQRILELFSDYPSQQKVVRFLLENGFGISRDGKVVVNDIEITASALSRAVKVDRRVVDTTIKRIAEFSELEPVFTRLRVTPDFTDVAKYLGLSVITILPKNAGDKNIVSSAVAVLAEYASSQKPHQVWLSVAVHAGPRRTQGSTSGSMVLGVLLQHQKPATKTHLPIPFIHTHLDQACDSVHHLVHFWG